jgi:tetratricopeptide (TPR) repeat protein
MKLHPFILFGILACFWAAPAPAGPPENAEYLEKVDSYQKAIVTAKDGREQALLHKHLGDLHAAWEEYGKASDEYVRALALAPSDFTAQERLRMAISISGRTDTMSPLTFSTPSFPRIGRTKAPAFILRRSCPGPEN